MSVIRTNKLMYMIIETGMMLTRRTMIKNRMMTPKSMVMNRIVPMT